MLRKLTLAMATDVVILALTEASEAGGQSRSKRARRKEESAQRRLVPLHRPALCALHRRRQREG
jgi:hypothetical protein